MRCRQRNSRVNLQQRRLAACNQAGSPLLPGNPSDRPARLYRRRRGPERWALHTPRTISTFETDAGANRAITRSEETDVSSFTGFTASGCSNVLCACISEAVRMIADAELTRAPRTAICVSRGFVASGFTTVSVTVFPLRDDEPFIPHNFCGRPSLV